MPKCFAPKESLIYAAQFCSTADLTADIMQMIHSTSAEPLVFSMNQDGFNFTKNGVEYHVLPRGWLIAQQGMTGFLVLTEEEFNEKYSTMSAANTGAPLEIKMSAVDLAIRTNPGLSPSQLVEWAKIYETYLMTGK